MVGAAAMLDQSGESTTELRAAVTSPGGTTAAAIRQLEKNGLRSAFYDALEAAKSRSAELGTSTE
jgi:pyrroline-5-carboxylate reductase